MKLMVEETQERQQEELTLLVYSEIRLMLVLVVIVERS